MVQSSLMLTMMVTDSSNDDDDDGGDDDDDGNLGQMEQNGLWKDKQVNFLSELQNVNKFDCIRNTIIVATNVDNSSKCDYLFTEFYILQNQESAPQIRLSSLN